MTHAVPAMLLLTLGLLLGTATPDARTFPFGQSSRTLPDASGCWEIRSVDPGGAYFPLMAQVALDSLQSSHVPGDTLHAIPLGRSPIWGDSLRVRYWQYGDSIAVRWVNAETWAQLGGRLAGARIEGMLAIGIPFVDGSVVTPILGRRFRCS